MPATWCRRSVEHARGLRSSPAGSVVWGAARAALGGRRLQDSVACGAGRHTHNFSIHSPSITSVQLEAVMGSTRLCSSRSAACSRAASDAAAATQAARSAVSSGPQPPPAMLGRRARFLGRACGSVSSGLAASLPGPMGPLQVVGGDGR